MRSSPLFFSYLIIELITFFIVGRFVGGGFIFLIILATGVLGVLILRLAGISTLLKMRQKMEQGQAPDSEMLNGLLLGMGGLLLISPGLLGDLAGTILVIPFTRQLLIKRAGGLAARYSQKTQSSFSETTYHSSTQTSHKPDIIEGEWERKDK